MSEWENVAEKAASMESKCKAGLDSACCEEAWSPVSGILLPPSQPQVALLLREAVVLSPRSHGRFGKTMMSLGHSRNLKGGGVYI